MAEAPPLSDIAVDSGGSSRRWVGGVWLTGLSLLIPELLGSVFNIVYNMVHVETLLDERQLDVFFRTIGVFNFTVYPVATAVW